VSGPDRDALVGFALGVLCILVLLAAHIFGIGHWIPGPEGPTLVYVGAILVSLGGSLLSFLGCFSLARRSLAVAGLVLSLAAVLVSLGFLILEIALSHAYQYGSTFARLPRFKHIMSQIPGPILRAESR
jgi:hypothetical protein